MTRIVHISDIHLDNATLKDAKTFILDPLILDLKDYNKDKQIDLVVISGDLINKGGGKDGALLALLEFEEIVINPILKAINLTNESCFFVPGNHDIMRSLDNEIEEAGMVSLLDSVTKVNKFIDDNCINSLERTGIKRISPFKEFEANFHQNYNEEYQLTNFNSSFIKTINNTKIGITCFNSAWRSYDSLSDKGKILLGERQITNSIEFIENTDIKIAIIHHPLDWFNDIEKPHIDSFIHREYDMLFCGHVHQGSSWAKNTGVYGNIAVSVAPANWQYGIRENKLEYSNGYSIVDYNNQLGEIVTHHRIFSYNRKKFVPNVHIGDDFGKQTLHVGNPADRHKQAIKFEISKKIEEIYFPQLNEHLLSYHTETCAPKEINELFVFPRLISRIDYNIEKKEEYIDKIEELCSCEENTILLGTKEAGKTIILDKLLMNFTKKIEIYNKIPVYTKFENIPVRIETLISQYLNIGILEIDQFLTEQKIILLIDDVSYDKYYESELIKIEKFLKKYNNASAIMTSTQRLSKEVPIELLEVPFFAAFKILHISEFRTKEIKQLIKNWFSGSKKHSTPKINKILKTFIALNLPRTPLALSMFLWIIEQQEDYKPVNQAAMLENYIQNLFKKQKRTVLSSEFDYQNKERLLADIAVAMYKSDQDHYCLSKNDLIVFISDYLKNKRFNFDADRIMSHFLNVGVLFEEKRSGQNCITFQFNCFFEFFLSKKMDFDSDFRTFVLSDNQFLKFVNEIDYYTGLKRDQIEILKLLLSRMNKEYKQLLFSINELPYGFDTLFIVDRKKESIKDALDITEIMEKGKPTENELDELQDEALAALPVESRVEKKEEVMNQMTKLDKLWEVTAKVLKNTEEIDEGNLKSEGLKQVISCGMAFSCLYKSYLTQQLLKNKDNLYPKAVENMEILNRFMPLAYEAVLYTFVGTAKLSIVLKEKIENEINDSSISDYEKFVAVFLLADIKSEDQLFNEIRQLINSVKHIYVYDLMIFKIMSYYLLRSKTEKTDKLLLNMLAEINIKSIGGTKAKDKERIINHFKQFKKDEIKNIEENAS